ncbi:MAG: hypothetical protein ACI81A_000446 [Paraglaciecola sp.]|jgi:hypothetical protein
MLLANRFDYFPRGISEIWREEELFDTLVIEKKLLLHYPAVEYFFVQAGNIGLAQQIELGLRRAKKMVVLRRYFNVIAYLTAVSKKLTWPSVLLLN